MKVPKDLKIISPRWSARIENETLKELREPKKVGRIELDLNIPMYCVVGEAWKFKPNPEKCDECFTYGMDIWGTLYDKDEFKQSLTSFTRHFKDKHKKRFESKRNIKV